MTIDTNSKEKPQTQNNAVESPNDYQKALDLAEIGRHEEALGHIQKHLSSSPNDAEALNDAGALLHCLDRSDEAIDCLLKARDLQPESAEIIWNLSETYLASGKASEAMELFEDMDRMGILNPDLLNRTANVFLNEANLADALKLLNRSLELSPNQEILRPMIEVISHKMTQNSCE